MMNLSLSWKDLGRRIMPGTLVCLCVWCLTAALAQAADSGNQKWDCVVVTVEQVDRTVGTRDKPPVVGLWVEDVLTRGKYPEKLRAIWEPVPVMCGVDPEARPDAPVDAPKQGSRWVAWIQPRRGKDLVLLRSFMSHPYSKEMRSTMAMQCYRQGLANEHVVLELERQPRRPDDGHE